MRSARSLFLRNRPCALLLAGLGWIAAKGSAQAVVYHFDQIAAQTVCTATTAITITTTTLTGVQQTLSSNPAAAGDYELRMDAAGFGPTYAQRMYTPAFAGCSVLAANATFALYARVSWTGTTPQWQIRLYDDDPSVACAPGTSIGQSAWTNNAGGSGTYATTNLTITNAAYSVAAGHRIRFEVWFRAFAGTTNCRVRYGQAGSDTFLTTSESACVTNATTVGSVTAVSSTTSCTSIDVTAPYTGDSNGGNTLSYRYRTPSGSGAWTGPTALSHSVSPYSFTITGLTHGATYDVEVTYVDADGVTGTNPQTVSNVTVGPNCTAAGTVTASQTTGATPSIGVSAPYTFDNNANNTLSYRYRTPSGSGAWIGPAALGHSASPYSFTLSSLTCGATYDVEVTYADVNGIGSGIATQTISNILLSNCSLAGLPTATVDSCTQITVSGPFTQNTNADGATTYERGPAAIGPWTAACSGLTGASPRNCADTGVLASTSYYYRVTYVDPDGVGGTGQQVIGPFTTPACAVLPVTPGAPAAAVDSCSQITISIPYSGDTNGNSTTLAEYNTSNSWPGTTSCAAISGASPRNCVVSGLSNATAYWFRVTFSDADGVAGTNPQIIGPFSTFDCRTTSGAASATVDSCTQITVSEPYSGDWNSNGRTTFERGSSATGFWSAICSNLPGASPRNCVDSTLTGGSTAWYRVTVTDTDGVGGSNPQIIGPYSTPACVLNATTVTANTAAISSCRQITVTSSFTGDGNRNGTTLVEYNTLNSWPGTAACATLSGSSPRTCLVTGLAPSTSYWIRVTFTDSDGVAGTNPQVLGPLSTPVCGADQTAPTLLVLVPARDAILGGTDRAKVQVFDAGGLAAVNPVQWAVDGGAFSTAVSVNASYNCDAPSLPGKCKIYEFDLVTTALSNGNHALTIQATDAAGNIATFNQPFQSRNSGGAASGAGTLLRRSTGSQLCLDCHNLQTHSSQYTSTTHGNWAIDCLTCHTPHKTTNIHLIRNTLATPSSGNATVVFRQDDKAGGTNPQLSYLGDYSGAGNTPYNDGICESCHTKTSHYRNDSSGGDHTHNTAVRCISCHKHDTGFAGAACNACHKAPPAVGKHGKHDEVGSVPTSYTMTASHATTVAYGFACAKCHSGSHMNDTHAGSNADPYRVELTFDATVDPKNSLGAYSQVYPGAPPSPDQGNDLTKYWSWTPTVAGTDGNCSNLYCHSNAAPSGGGTNLYATPKWNQAAALTCTSCHATTGRDDTAVLTDLSQKHGKHLKATTYAFTCDECHAATVLDNSTSAIGDKTMHVNGVKDLVFSTTATAGSVDQSAGIYAASSCSSLYCHSQGTTTTAPFLAPLATMLWNTGTTSCESCHAGNAAATNKMSTNAHTPHMNQAAYIGTNFMCYRCHQDTVSSLADTTINTFAFHVNGARNVKLADGGTYAAWGCSNAYCHSSGQAVAAPIQYYNPPNWNSGSTLTNDCKACHGRHADNAFVPIGGEPNYANGGAGNIKANTHQKHVTALTDCGSCHNDTSTTGTSIVASSIRHIDSTRDVAIAPAYDTNGGTKYDNYTAATKTCNNIACHGAGTPQWGGTVYCISCHGAANDLDNWNINDGTMSTISTNEWGYSGHGKAAGTYDVTLNSAANFGAGGPNPCLYCHDDTVSHKTAANPFRLRNTGGADGQVGVCLACHKTASTGVDPDGATATYSNINGISKINAYHYATKHGAGNNGGRFCWDCHDPHGDRSSTPTGNVAMIHSSVTKQSDGTYGIPATQVSPTFTANSIGTDFAKVNPGPYTGLCNVCHTTTNHYTSIAGDGHNTGLKCDQAGCHVHDQPPDKAFYKGESDGDDDCLNCHTFGMVASEASRTTTYHHALEVANKLSAGLTTYPTSATPTVGTVDQDKTCVQCHADHNVFRPDINLSNTLGRGANLRSRIANAPPAVAKGVNPAAAPGDAATGYYWNRDADGSFTNGGICLSCHTNPQTKNVTDQKTYAGDPASTTAIVPVAADFFASSHSFTVGGQITTGSSAFNIACTKCHSTTSTNYQNGTWKFQLHTSDNRRLLNPLGITAPVDPLEENFCFRCHSRTTDTTPGGGPVKGAANRDYYNQTGMSNQAELLFNEFSNAASYPWDHPVQGTGGLHDAVEGAAANDGTIGGAQRHVQCEDCHNPHAVAPIASGNFAGSVTAYTANVAPTMDVLTDGTKGWAAGSLVGYTVKITTGAQTGKFSTIYANGATTLSVEFATAPLAGVAYIIVNPGVRDTGNQVSPAQRDVWGVAPTWPAPPAPPNWNDTSTATAADITTQYTAIATWNRTTSAPIQGQICIKCHSAYAYGASPPNTPGGAGNSTTATWGNTAGAVTAQSDVADQFNPNNLGHHAIFARGKNQPLVSSDVTTSTYNPNWPKYTTGTLTATNGSTAVTLTGGTFPSTTLPGWFLFIGNTAPAQGIAGWFEISSIVSGTSVTLDRAYTGATGGGKVYMLTAGLGNNFVPPWGPWSTLACSDCHTSSVATDPFGPHASANKWLLRAADTQVFDFYNGTSVATVTNTPSDANLFCINCHRRDVYGDDGFTSPGSATFARQTHPVDNGQAHSTKPKWGIICLNCHGGARIGTIHGTSLGRGANGVAGSYSGKRLLAGAAWYGVTRGTTTVTGACWTKAAADSVNNCARAHTNQTFSSGNANYNYDSNP